jgi:hypothetical protein
MRERRSMFASAMFALVVMAGTFAQSMPGARGDECITKPNAPAPQGQHWYYRIDHANDRQCWRLGPEGIPVLKNAPRAEKTPASGATTQSALPPQVQASVTTASAIASAESAFDSNVAETTASMRWPEAPILPELPRSPQPIPQPTPAESIQTANTIASAPPVERHASVSNRVEEPLRRAATRLLPAVPKSAVEVDHTFALLMIMFAVLAVAGPILHYAERRRKREASNFQVPRWARVVALNAPTPRIRLPLPLDPEIGTRGVPVPLRVSDQTERLTHALQQLVDRLQTHRPTVTFSARRTGIEMMKGAR